VGGGEAQPPEHDFRDSARKVVRGLDGTLMAEPLVWTARVARLRVQAESAIKATHAGIVLLFALFLALVFCVAGFLLAYTHPVKQFTDRLSETGHWLTYTFTILVALGVLIVVGKVFSNIRWHFTAKSTTRIARSTWEQLVLSDLGVMIANPVYWQIVFERLDDAPMKKWLCPPPPRNFEAHLEWAAINCKLLSLMNKDGVEPSAGKSSACAWQANTKLSIPCACGISLSSCAFPLNIITAIAAIFSIIALQHAAKSRMIAICDFLLEDYSAWYLQGWHEPYPEARVLRQITRPSPPGLLGG